MTALRRVGALVVAAVALATVAIGWMEELPSITAAQAVEVTEHAFAGAGIAAVVEAEATSDTYESSTRRRVEVWKTIATIDDATVQLYLQAHDAEPVYLDDRTPDGDGQLLSDAQFEAVVEAADNPALTERVRRNLTLTLGAIAVLAMAIALAVAPGQNAHRR